MSKAKDKNREHGQSFANYSLFQSACNSAVLAQTLKTHCHTAVIMSVCALEGFINELPHRLGGRMGRLAELSVGQKTMLNRVNGMRVVLRGEPHSPAENSPTKTYAG